jgi:ATP-dependent Zn protease
MGIAEAVERARQLVNRHTDAIRVAATELLKRRSLTGEQVRAIVAAYPPADRADDARPAKW